MVAYQVSVFFLLTQFFTLGPIDIGSSCLPADGGDDDGGDDDDAPLLWSSYNLRDPAKYA